MTRWSRSLGDLVYAKSELIEFKELQSGEHRTSVRGVERRQWVKRLRVIINLQLWCEKMLSVESSFSLFRFAVAVFFSFALFAVPPRRTHSAAVSMFHVASNSSVKLGSLCWMSKYLTLWLGAQRLVSAWAHSRIFRSSAVEKVKHLKSLHSSTVLSLRWLAVYRSRASQETWIPSRDSISHPNSRDFVTQCA